MPLNLNQALPLMKKKLTRGTANSHIYAAGMSSSEGESSTGGAGCQNGSWYVGGGLGVLVHEAEARLS